ncbi:flagellar basal body-associated protein FliL [compost metagenome]
MANNQPGGNGLNIKLVVLAVVIAVISGVSSFVAIRLAMPQQIIVEKHIQEVEGKKAESHEPELGPVYPVGEFIVNLSDPGRRYLKTTVVLQMTAPSDNHKSEKGGGSHGGGDDSSAAIKAEMAPFEPLYKDAIITTLARQTVATINAPGGRNTLKEELKTVLNQRVPGKTVMDVYFTDFVIQ